jgi:hypothetical protein
MQITNKDLDNLEDYLTADLGKEESEILRKKCIKIWEKLVLIYGKNRK